MVQRVAKYQIFETAQNATIPWMAKRFAGETANEVDEKCSMHDIRAVDRHPKEFQRVPYAGQRVLKR